ncbi:MAG TPA: hypothetical protein VNW23_03865 [Opitutaceae bacterium]|jgi:hypothetical protein|nr:hypothetical protein [Opitutaceae bacterium]
MHKYLSLLVCIAFATLIGVSVGKADDQEPTLAATQQWLVDHQNDFTSACSFSNDSQNSFVMTIQKVGILLKNYNPKEAPFPGCLVHFYGKIHVEAYDSNNAYEAVATFRAEDVSDVVEVRKLDQKYLGPEAQNFDARGCYCVVIRSKEPNSNTIEMNNLGVPYLQRQELHYIVIPIADYALAGRLAKALHHGIQLIQAQMATKPEAF